jgi:glycerate kinase
LAEVDISGIDIRFQESEFVVACDVDNPLCGALGASAVYGPQKGASPDVVSELDAALCNFATLARKATGKDVADRPGAGAAGGLGAGLMYFSGAILRPGVEIVFETTGLPSLVQTADLIITGEGMTDSQTAFGKAPAGIGNLAKKYGKIAICLSGSLGTGAEDVLKHGIQAVIDIIPRPMNLQECMASAASMIEIAASRMARLLKAGILLRTESAELR